MFRFPVADSTGGGVLVSPAPMFDTLAVAQQFRRRRDGRRCAAELADVAGWRCGITRRRDRRGATAVRVQPSLALAILLVVTDEATAERFYQAVQVGRHRADGGGPLGAGLRTPSSTGWSRRRRGRTTSCAWRSRSVERTPVAGGASAGGISAERRETVAGEWPGRPDAVRHRRAAAAAAAADLPVPGGVSKRCPRGSAAGYPEDASNGSCARQPAKPQGNSAVTAASPVRRTVHQGNLVGTRASTLPAHSMPVFVDESPVKRRPSRLVGPGQQQTEPPSEVRWAADRTNLGAALFRRRSRMNSLSQTNRVTLPSTVSRSRFSSPQRSPGGTRSAMRASIRRSASTSASAQSRSIVVVVGRIVRVCRQASTNLRARSSFDRASGASSRSRSPSSRAAWSEKDRNPYSRRSSARCSCRVSDRTA